VVIGDPNDSGGIISVDRGGKGISFGLGVEIHRFRLAWNDDRSSLVPASTAAVFGVDIVAIVIRSSKDCTVNYR
jgi:hypothetical protein